MQLKAKVLMLIIIFIINPNINLWGVSKKKEYSAQIQPQACVDL